MSTIYHTIRKVSSDLGFADVGFARCRPPEHAQELLAWLAAGHHGSMSYLQEQLAERLDPQLLLPGARSLILVADQYALRDGRNESPQPGSGRVARYARGRDYHDFVKRRLHELADALRPAHPGHKFRSCVDTAPLLEREFAAYAGLGWIGKNSMLIHPARGSYFVLGAIVTTLEFPDLPANPVPDHCGTCTRCIDACPTQAITPHSVNGSRCISYLTIEHQGAIDSGLHAAMGDWLFGCDICQEVCPHNSPRETAAAMPEPRPGLQPPQPGDWGTAAPRELEVDPQLPVQPAYAVRRSGFPLLEVLNWDENARREAFRTSSMKRATLENMRRNALIAAGNALATHPHQDLLERIRAIAHDATESDVIRQTAAAVLERLARSE